MPRMRRLLAAAGLVAAAVIGVAAPASAGAPANRIDLNNATASAGNDCPTTGGPYWHFVLAPNNGTFSFQTITLNLGTAQAPDLHSFPAEGPIIPNGTQKDNVFVQVPTGYLLTDLQTSGSFATYTSTTGRAPNRFNLSSVCTNYTGVAPEVLGETQVAAAVETSGSLPYTGSNSTLPMAQIGVGLLAAGALATFIVRKRHTSSSEA